MEDREVIKIAKELKIDIANEMDRIIFILIIQLYSQNVSIVARFISVILYQYGGIRFM